MGTLLVKKYLSNLLPGTSFFINKLVLLGSPQLGSPLAFKVLNYGDNLNFTLGPFDVLNPNKAKDITQNMPGVYELLPSRRYIQTNGSYVKDFRNGNNQSLSFDQTKQLMLNNASDTRNQSLLNVADVFHQNLDDQPFNANNVYNIVGCLNPSTISEFQVYDNNVVDVKRTSGDGTVPATSALNLLSSNFRNYFALNNETGIDHNGLVSDYRTVELVSNIINNSVDNVNLPQGISTSTADCFTPRTQGANNETTIEISTHSPVALHVYDSEGRHTGPMPGGDIELGIQGSTYQQIGENSFILVPATTTPYRIVNDSLSSGTFTMKVKGYEGAALTESATYISVPLQSDQTTAELNFSGFQNPLDLELDQNGDGTPESTIPPTAILPESQASDFTPPSIEFYISPEEVELNATATISFSVDDDSSGVSTAAATFNGNVVNNGDVVAFPKIKDNILKIEAVDRAGNPAVREARLGAVYKFPGFLPPLRPNGLGTFTKGQILYIRFQLTDAFGIFVSSSVPQIYIARLANNGSVVGQESLLTSKFFAGGIPFRYDRFQNYYISGILTGSLPTGLWRFRVALDDGKSYNAIVLLRASMLNEKIINDVTPPSIAMLNIASTTPSGAPITFTFSVSDDLSGVASATLTLDGIVVQNGFTTSKLAIGNHVFAVNAVDYVGNSTSRQLAFKVVLNKTPLPVEVIGGSSNGE